MCTNFHSTALQWSPETLALFAAEVDLIVGCTSSLELAARDTSMNAVTRNHTGNYHVLLYPLVCNLEHCCVTAPQACLC